VMCELFKIAVNEDDHRIAKGKQCGWKASEKGTRMDDDDGCERAHISFSLPLLRTANEF
jgi:hypothetical protein